MKTEDAISTLKHERPTCDTRECGKTLCEAVDVAIEALEKQIELHPKLLAKDIPDAAWEISVTCAEMGQCPACSEVVMNTDNYCSNCGQRLSWETNGEE